MKNEEFVLFTSDEEYVVEYLFNELALSKSMTKAKTFVNVDSAIKFKKFFLKK